MLANLGRETTATTGTGTITLGGAVTGHLTFVLACAAAGIASGSTVTYAIEDGANSEVGRGVWTSPSTLTRATILASTNSNNAISLSGTAEVFITAAAEDLFTGALHPLFTPVVAADFTARNSAAALVTNANGGVYCTAAASASDTWKWHNKNVPSTPYTITIFVTPNLVSTQYLFSGFVWDDGTKLVTFGIDTGTLIGEHSLTCRDWTNATTHSGDNKLQQYIHGPNGIWLRAGEDASNRIMSFSKDGYNFIPFLTETRTNHLTATKVGFGVNSRNSSWQADMTIRSWKQT